MWRAYLSSVFFVCLLVVIVGHLICCSRVVKVRDARVAQSDSVDAGTPTPRAEVCRCLRSRFIDIPERRLPIYRIDEGRISM